MGRGRGNQYQDQQNGNQSNQQHQQENNQQGQYVNPNYKGKKPWNSANNNGNYNNGNHNNGNYNNGNYNNNNSSNSNNNNNGNNFNGSNNGAQSGPRNSRQHRNGAQNNGFNTNDSNYDPEQSRLFDAWKKQQQELKRQQQIEAEALFLQNQKHLVENRSQPPLEVTSAIEFLKVLSKKPILDDEKQRARSAVDVLQSYVNQQGQLDQESQENLSILVGWVLWFGNSSTTLSDPKVARTISKAIKYWEVRLGVAPERKHSKSAAKKEDEGENSQLETNVHVEWILHQFDMWLKKSGLTFARIDGKKVYYTNALAATEEESKREVSFVDMDHKPGWVRLEGNNSLMENAELVRTAEHAFIVWFTRQEASKKLALAKEENKTVMQKVARLHPEARKKYEAFEWKLGIDKATIELKDMQARLDFEESQKVAKAKLEEYLEQQRREFFGLPSPDVVKPEASHVPTFPSVASPTRKSPTMPKRDSYSALFASLKVPAKPVDPTVPVAVKKPKVDERKKKKLVYPQFQHTSTGVFVVDLYTGDPPPDKRGDGRITQDVNGTYVFIKPIPMPCVKGCRECWALSGEEEEDMEVVEEVFWDST